MAYRKQTLVFALLITFVVGFDKRRFPGPYCQTRTPQQCCPNRDDTCTVPIYDTLCYCDQFCGEHSVEDCCPDFFDTCTNKRKVENRCIKEGQYYQIGDTVVNGCNTCSCVQSDRVVGNTIVQQWQCGDELCINDKQLVDRVNSGKHGWSASTYNKFDGVMLKDGSRYYLGTKQPLEQVVRLNPLLISPDEQFEREFDSRERWPRNYIHPAIDQGQCASSWAFSTASVAADRISIQSEGKFIDQLSVQNILSCNRFVEGCDGGRIVDAWYHLQTEGAVSELCYPYTSGSSRKKGSCRELEDLKCSGNSTATVRRTTPPYRIAKDERQIMKEIKTQGPVQAIITVQPDFYLYERGIYQHSREEMKDDQYDPTLIGTHSVKIIGWGEEDGVKYWLCVNSWGRRWGEDGMFRIRRGTNESGIENFVIGVWARIDISG